MRRGTPKLSPKFAKWHGQVLKVVSFLRAAADVATKHDKSPEAEAYWTGVYDAADTFANMVAAARARKYGGNVMADSMPAILEKLSALEVDEKKKGTPDL